MGELRHSKLYLMFSKTQLSEICWSYNGDGSCSAQSCC